ncbi:sodium transporter [Pseudomonas syringae pv. syringae]|nr:sodium transporter [Pseudomonas syringae pv. syringae]
MLFAILAFLFPQAFIGLKSWIVPLLGLVMFGMGLTLKLEDFSEVARNPWRVALGVIAHFVIMPGVAWLLCQVFQLPPEIAVGVILVGCCPSGTSSNVMAWLAKGDLALAVAIAAVTTLLAPLLTPTLIWFLASAWLPVSFLDMFWSILQLVMLPIVLGVIAQRLLGARVSYAVDVLPLVSVVSIVMIVCAVVAASQAKIAESGLLIMADALASAHFSPLAAVPSALFSVWHNISGALLSTYFRKMPEEENTSVR